MQLRCAVIDPELPVATKGTVNEGSPCSANLAPVGVSDSVKASLSMSASSYVGIGSDHASVLISHSAAQLLNMSCNSKEGNGVTADQLLIDLVWTLRSSGPGSCAGVGSPELACLESGPTIVLRATHACEATSDCDYDFAAMMRIYPPPGDDFVSVTFHVEFSGRQSGREPSPVSTSMRATWLADDA